MSAAREPIVWPKGDGPSTIAARLRRLGYPVTATYADYLESRHWLHIQLRYSESGLPQTCACGGPRDALHHKTYVRLGNEKLVDLEPVCDDCHRELHARRRRGPKPKQAMSPNEKRLREKYGLAARAP